MLIQEVKDKSQCIGAKSISYYFEISDRMFFSFYVVFDSTGIVTLQTSSASCVYQMR